LSGITASNQINNDLPPIRVPIVIRSANIYTGIHSEVKSIQDLHTIEIVTPYDVNGEHYYIAMGESITVEWDTNSEAHQKEFVVKNYQAVSDFLQNSKLLPTVILSSEDKPTEISHITRNHYRTWVKIERDMSLITSESEQLAEEKKVELSDVSGGGISFLYERPIAPGKKIYIDLPIFDHRGNIVKVPVEGHIVNIHMIHPKKFKMGVKFHKIPVRYEDAIVGFVNACTGKKKSGNCKTCSLRHIGICTYNLRN
jgi:c-di-GMP-binding flagellar brake protein YcgR